MGHGGFKVVHEEWLGEVVLVVREWHGLEVQGHGGSALDISELVHTGCSVAVGVEELSCLSSVLWEVSIVSTLIPLLIVIYNVVSLWGE